MKLRTEISPEMYENEEVVIIHCRARSEKVKLIESVIENILAGDTEIVLYINDTEFYIPKNDILFFETNNGKISAHTADRIFTTNYKLIELEHILPPNFVRVSKSCILNASKVEAINSNLTGASEVFFRDTKKMIYVSRGYFKLLKKKINEMRFS